MEGRDQPTQTGGSHDRAVGVQFGDGSHEWATEGDDAVPGIVKRLAVDARKSHREGAKLASVNLANGSSR
jgi:hypothetical protein